ncbi:MAG TPA: hypothetical protein VJS67_04435, partial [Pseudonocardiaceae bacterium]|nr:hypothetical protein [Pseudonocardiaceae bacterium]
MVISARHGTSPARRRATARKGHPTVALRTRRPAAPGARREEITTLSQGQVPTANTPYLSTLG